LKGFHGTAGTTKLKENILGQTYETSVLKYKLSCLYIILKILGITKTPI
jgi:hypothetical protein